MFNFYKTKSRWLRVFTAAMFYVLVNSGGLFAQTNYYSKAAATDFTSTASWGANTDGSGAAPGSVSNADNFIIQNGSVMNLAAGSAAVRNLTINAGSLTVGANTLTVSLPTGRTAAFVINNGGSFTVTGGNVVVNGNMGILGTASWTQSGGTISIDGNDAGVAGTSVASGTPLLNITSSTLNLTGGTLIIVDPHANATLTDALYYNTGTSYNSGSGHTVQFGDGVSTDAGGNAVGARHNTWVGSGRFLFGNLIINSAAGTNRHVQSNWSHGVAGNLTVTLGEYRINNACHVAGNVSVTGTLTTTSTLQFGTFLGGTIAASPNAQTVSGAGTFRNLTASPTANFNSLTINNSNASGVTFSNANSVLSGANTGTVSGTLTFTSGLVTTSGTPVVLGISGTSAGTFSYTAGGFTSGSSFRRWFTTGSMTTGATPTTNAFPFAVGSQSRMVTMNKSAAWITGGWIEATHTHAAGLAAAGFLDGAYSVDQRTNAGWSFTSGGGINLGATTLAVGLRAEGLVVTAAAPGTAPRLVQAAGALKTHAAGTGTSAAPFGNRSAFVLADLTGGSHYVGIANADIGLYSVASGNWTTPGTWSTGVVPTAADNPLVAAGTTVTVNAASTALTATVAGTLNVASNTLTLVGASTTGLAINGGGVVSVSGGTIDIGPQDNSFCNRRLTISSGGSLSVSSGNVNVAGNFALASGGALTQSGGTIRVDGNAANVAGNSVASGTNLVDFTVSNAANCNLTGGTFLVVDPHTGTGTANRAFANQTGVNFALGVGHTFQFGDGVSTDGTANTGGFVQETYVGSTRMLYGNLVIDAGNTGNRQYITQQFTGQFVGVQGNMTITSGNYYLTGVLTVAGNLVNNGTLTSTGTLAMSNSSGTGTYVTGTNAQTISGTGTFQNLLVAPTAQMTNFRIQNSHASGVTMNIPLTMSGTLTMFEGRLTTTSTNLLTMTATTSNVAAGTTTAGYISGPIRRIAPASSTNLSYFFPVGQTGANWLAIYNLTTTAGGAVTIDVSGDNTVNAPNTFDGSLTTLNTGREWTTTIVSGAANLSTYSMQGYDGAMVSGNALAGILSPATDFSVLGGGSNLGAPVAPLSQYLTTTLPPLAGSTFPDRVSYGNTGPLNVTGSVAYQVTGNVSLASTNNDLTRLVISASGSSGTVTLTDLIWTYTGTNAADIAANGITLWSGTFTAPTAQIGAGVSLSGGLATFSGLSVNIPSGATYLWIRANVGAGATIGNNIDGEVETGNLIFATSGGATATPPIPAADLDPAGNRLIDYCQAIFTNACTSNDVLTAFSINTLSSSPNCPGPATTNYGKLLATTTLQQGNAYTANFTTGSGGAQGVAIWFDFNHDGDFADAGEFFATGATVAANTAGSLGVTIDPAALTGTTRMRVMNRWNATFTQGQVCLNPINYGTTVDYDVTIISPTPRTLDPITVVQQTQGMGISTTNNNLLRVDMPTTGSLGTLTLTQIRFQYSGTTAADIAASGVTLWTGTTGGPVTQVGSAVSLSGGFANFTGLSVALGATNYLWLRVNTSASAVIANLVDARILTGDITITAAGGATAPGTQPPADLDPVGSAYIDYCVPTYANGCGLGDDITNVTLAGASLTLNNTSGCTPNPYYTYYNAATQPDMYPGVTYPISVTFGTEGNQWAGVWIDFDQDGVLETTEYFAPVVNAGASGTSTFNIVVPAGATLGTTRMRVRGGNDAALVNTQACGASSSAYGETEDYIVNIIPPPNCSTLLPFPATATTASPTTVCSGSSVSFNITVPMPAGTGITYQLRRNGTNLGASVTSLPHTIAVTLAGNYDFVISCNGTPQVTSTSVALTVLTPTVTGTTPATRCGPGTVTVSATGSVGTSMKWYSVPTGGAPLATGGSYATPSLGVGVTPYYVSANQIFGTENVGKASFTPGTGFITTDWGIVFSALSDITLNSVDIYPDGTGDIVIGLYESDATTLIAETPAIPVSGTLTLQTVPLNFDVPAGANYRLLVKSYTGITGLGRESTGLAFPYNSGSGAVSITASEWGGTTTGTYYFFYNFNVSRVCSSPRSTVNATVTAPPALGVNVANPTICNGQSTGANAFGTGYTSFVWSPSGSVSPVGPGAVKALNPTTTTTYQITATGGGCNNSTSVTVYVKPTPTNPVLNAVPATGQCLGASKNLTATATAGGNTILFASDFNDLTLGGWTTNSGGTSPTSWAVQNAPYSYAAQITNFSVSTPTSPFVMVNSDVLGSGSADGFAEIISPSFSTLGYSSVSLSFDHVFRTTGLAGMEASVQYSTDGGLTWSADVYSTTVVTPTQTWVAGAIVTANQVISLPAGAANKASVRLRFRNDYDWDYYWMVDNIQIYAPVQVEYRWSANSAFAGIPVPAQTFGTGNGATTVTPTGGGSMVYTVEVRNTAGCLAATTATHGADISEIIIAPSNTGPQRVGTTLGISTTFTGGFGGYGFQWRKLPSMTVINATSAFSYTNAQVSHSGTYQVTVTDGQGCSAVQTTDALVFAALVWNGSQSSSWTDPLNWTPPIVPTNDCAENVVITTAGTPPVFPGPAQNIGNFALEEGSTLTLNNNIQVCGSLTGSILGMSTVNGTGVIELTGSGNVFVGGKSRLDQLIINKSAGTTVTFTGKTYITDLLTISNSNAGIVVGASGEVILESNLTNTARVGVVPPGTAISVVAPGKFTQKRTLPFTIPNTPGLGQWYFLGSAMNAKPFTDWSDDFKASGYTGSFSTQGGGMITHTVPEHTTIFKQVESSYSGRVDTVQKRGWRIPGSGENIEVGKGYRVFVHRHGMDNDQFDNSGLINYGNVTLPVLTSTNESPCTNTTSDWCYTSDRGFNFVSNPYPCDIDWEASAVAWPKPATMQNTYYRWVSGLDGYGAYTNGGLWTGVTPAPANARYIPSSQSYFVRLNPAGATYSETWSITEAAKSLATAGAFARSATNDNPMLRVHMTQPSLNGSYGYETVIRFMDEASDEYDFNYDISALGGNKFHMSYPVGGQNLAINSLHTLTESRIVPVATYFKGTAGVFELRFTGLASMPNGCSVYLKDNYLNVLHDLSAAPVYSFHVANGNASSMEQRFELVFSPSSVTGATKQIGGVHFGMYPNPTSTGQVNVVLNGLNDAEGNLLILDVLGKEVFHSSVDINQNSVTDKNLKLDLPAGVYTVKFTSPSHSFSDKLIIK